MRRVRCVDPASIVARRFGTTYSSRAALLQLEPHASSSCSRHVRHHQSQARAGRAMRWSPPWEIALEIALEIERAPHARPRRPFDLAPNLLVAADPGPAPVPRPPRALPPPVLIIDGANVAFNYSRDARFEARGIRLCVDYYLRRTTGRRLHAAEMAVILNENRWDAADPELAYVDQLGCISRISRHGHPCMQVLTTAPSPPLPPGASHSHPRASTTTSSYSSAALITARGP